MITSKVSAPARMRLRPVLAVVVGPLLLLTMPTLAAEAGGSDRQSYAAKLTSKRPGTATGLHVAIDYVNPADPTGKPYAVKDVVIRLPQGARIDTSAVAACRANEAELLLGGASACPPASKVGTGTLSADTGLPGDPLMPRVVEARSTFFNNTGELILLAETTNTPAPLRVVSRFQVGTRTFSSTVPPLPGAPPPEPFLAIDRVVNMLDGPASGAPYIRTPPICPKSRRWRMSASFTYRDGVVQSERVSAPCRRR
jgi:hypothetical protein